MLEQADSSSTPRTLPSQRIKAPRRPARANSLNIIVYERVHDNYICMRPRCFLLCQQHVHDCRMGTHHKAHHTGRYCELIYYVNLIVCILENHICNFFFFPCILTGWLCLPWRSAAPYMSQVAYICRNSTG